MYSSKHVRCYFFVRILFLISIGAADEDHQREGRGIGLTAEERATARDALAAEEAARFATPADIKKAKAQAEIEKLKRKSKKSKQAVRSRASNKNAQRNQPKNSKEPYSVDHHEEQDTNTLKRVRGIGLTEEEKAEHAAALDAEEQKRFSESQDSKEARAKIEMEKLMKKTAKRSKKLPKRVNNEKSSQSSKRRSKRRTRSMEQKSKRKRYLKKYTAILSYDT